MYNVESLGKLICLSSLHSSNTFNLIWKKAKNPQQRQNESSQQGDEEHLCFYDVKFLQLFIWLEFNALLALWALILLFCVV